MKDFIKDQLFCIFYTWNIIFLIDVRLLLNLFRIWAKLPYKQIFSFNKRWPYRGCHLQLDWYYFWNVDGLQAGLLIIQSPTITLAVSCLSFSLPKSDLSTWSAIYATSIFSKLDRSPYKNKKYFFSLIFNASVSYKIHL